MGWDENEIYINSTIIIFTNTFEHFEMKEDNEKIKILFKSCI